MSEQRIAVVGTGANGAAIAADMTNAGFDVTCIEQWPAHVEAIRANGVTVRDPQGNEKVIEIVQTGQSFGEAVMFLRRPYPVSAHVLEDSMLLHVSESVISDAIETDNVSLMRKLLGAAPEGPVAGARTN